MTLGETIRAARQALNLTQQQVEERAGISYRSLSHIELGHVRPGRALTVDLAHVLALDVDTFCALAGHMPPDIEAWLLARPGRLAKVRRAMERAAAAGEIPAGPPGPPWIVTEMP